MDGEKLTPKQEFFCKEYLVDLNGTQAAIRAGYSPETAQEQSSRLLSNVIIQAYVQKLKDKRSLRLEIDADWVLNRFKEISDRCMVAEPVMINVDGELTESGEYKFDSSGATRSTEMIGKHIGFFEEHNKQQNQSKNFMIIPKELADKMNKDVDNSGA